MIHKTTKEGEMRRLASSSMIGYSHKFIPLWRNYLRGVVVVKDLNQFFCIPLQVDYVVRSGQEKENVFG